MKNKKKRPEENLKQYSAARTHQVGTPPQDYNAGDEAISGAETTAFPTYIDEKGRVKHSGPRTTIGQKEPPGTRTLEGEKKKQGS